MKKSALYFFLTIVSLGTMSNLYAQGTDQVEEQPTSEPDSLSEFPSGMKLTLIDTSQVEVMPEKPLPFVGVHHKVYQDSIVIRWAPSTRRLWLDSKKAGYLLERITYQVSDLDADSIPEDYAREIITALPAADSPILPYDSAQWAPYFPTTDKFALIAAGASGGQLEVEESQGFAMKGKQDQSIFGLVLVAADLSTLAADGLGLRYVDADIKKGEYYQYRVTSLDSAMMVFVDSLRSISPNDLLLAGDTANFRQVVEWQLRERTHVLYADSTIATRSTIEGFEAVSGDKDVILQWDANLGSNNYSGYLLERSTDGGLTYDSLTSGVFFGEAVTVLDTTDIDAMPRSVYQYVDHVDTNYVAFHYRIVGIDAFADRSEPATAKGMGRDLTAPANPILLSGEYIEAKAVIQLGYDILEMPADFDDLFFEYSNHVDSSYHRYEEESIDPNDSVYVHGSTPNEMSHYFRLVMTDTVGNRSESFPVFVHIPDTIAPDTPTGFEATIDSLGEVSLTWDDDLLALPDLRGFRLYFSNSPNHEFTPLNSRPIELNEYSYSIPLNTLTEKIYYKLQALDLSYNHSPMTDVVEAVKPDTIAPVAPVFNAPNVDESAVILSWTPSSSRDVAKQVLVRKVDEEQVVFEIENPNQNVYRDTTVSQGTSYQYRLMAIDDSGLASKLSFPVNAKIVDRKRIDGISDLKVEFDEDNQQVNLTWAYEQTDAEDLRFTVYRNKDSEKLKRHASVNGDLLSYSEKLPGGGTYYYGIRVMHRDGSRSSLSSWVAIVVQ